MLLSDHYIPPLEALFDSSEFVIKWPVSRIDDSLTQFLASLPLEVVERFVGAANSVRCWYLYPPPEVSWLGSWSVRQSLERVEKVICPNLSSSRNAFQAVVELLARKVHASRGSIETFHIPDPKRNYTPTVVNEDLVPL